MPSYVWPPVPPIEMPPARTLRIPDRGELFMRDTGGEGPAVMLLHGWMADADLNWCGAYADLAAAASAAQSARRKSLSARMPRPWPRWSTASTR